MPTTTNFGWTTPADTDLVKDGASAIRTLGNGIDTSMAELKGGTTGQILSKTSNTDMDFTWINNDTGDITGVTAGTGISGGGTSGTVTITNSMATEITAAGDIIVGTGSGTFDNLPIGTTGQVLTADTTVSPYKVKWAAAAAGATYVGVSAYRSTNTSINNATYTAVTWPNEYFDTDGFHSTTTNTSRFTVPTGKDGKYLVTSLVRFLANTTGIRIASLYKNGVELYQGSNKNPLSSGGTSLQFSWQGSLVATDYLEVFVYQDSGGALNISGDAASAWFTMTYLGA